MTSHDHTLREHESQITEDHLHLRELMERLKPVSDPNLLLPLLQELQTALIDHFDREEGDEGLYTIVNEAAPRHAPRVDELIAEHRVLLEDVTSLLRECHDCVAGPLARLRRNLGEFSARFEKHDFAETEILTDALLGDPDPEAD